MLSKIRKKLKETKGISSLEFVIGFLIFVILFSFLFDFFFIAYRQHQVSRLTTDITREIAIQSGIKNKTPTNYPGGDKNYITTAEAYDTISKYMNAIGVKDYTVTVSLKDRNSSTSTAKTFILTRDIGGYNTDYRGEVSVSINYKFKWGLWRSFVPTIQEGERTVTRTAFGEYKHDYSSWKGEQ